jgi:integrase
MVKNMELETELEESAYSLLVMAINSPITRKKYFQRLGYFLDYSGIENGSLEQRCNSLCGKAKKDIGWLTNKIIKYLQIHRHRVEVKEISGSTLRNYIKPIKLLCEQTDISVPWKKILRGLPKGRRFANDRAPTYDEIQLLTEYPDRRIKPIVYSMTSSGIRLGAWDYLRWGNISPITKDGKVVAAKIIVYCGEEDEYFSFITPEAWFSLNDWMEYRKQCGELIDENSWLMRNLWDVTTPKGKGVIIVPKKMKSSGIKRLIERALWAQGVRKNLLVGKKRHEFQADHGFRKWFKTRCELAGTKSINIETLMGHSLGISDSYYRATDIELLSDYDKAVDLFTVNEEFRLQKKVKELTDKGKDSEFIIKGRLEEKDKQIELLMKKQQKTEQLIQSLIDAGQLKPL